MSGGVEVSVVEGSVAPKEARRARGSGAALVLLAAGAVGVFADRGASLADPWGALAEVGTPFVLVAFTAGRQSSRMLLGALWGAAALSVGQAAYYAWLLLADGVAWGTITHHYRAGAWLVAGAVVGTLVGALGSASRARRRDLVRALAWGLIITVPLAECVRLARGEPPRISASTVLLIVAVALVGWAIRRDRAPWPSGIVTVVAVTPAVLLAESFRHLV